MKEIPRREPVDREMARFDRKHVAALRHIANRTIPNAGWSEAEIFAWRYRHDNAFKEAQKERTKASKAKVPLWYANQMLGGTSKHHYPLPLLEAKQLQLKIKKHLKENDHEEH